MIAMLPRPKNSSHELQVPNSATPQLVDKDFVLAKCDYFVDVQVWPIETTLNPRSWLENFTAEEQPYAINLLNVFLFYNGAMTDALLHGAVGDLARRIASLDSTYGRSVAQWTDFLDGVLVTYPTGEEPSVTDSGFVFARKARQSLSISEERILSPGETLEQLMRAGPRPVLFLDDFLGTGNQFLRTWNRPYATSAGDYAFSDVLGTGPRMAYYVPLLATSFGMAEVSRRTSNVTIAPAHALPPVYSALHPDSVLWPAQLRSRGPSIVQAASVRAGIPDTDGASTTDWQGFNKLGLCVGFEHGVPDATLPLFYWDKNDWHPLLKRS